MKKLFKLAGATLATVLVLYLCALGHFYWKWQVPHELLPQGLETVGEQVLYVPGYEELAKELDQLAKKRLQQWRAPSLSIAVAIEGKLVWAGARGYSHIEERVPATVGSQYRVGSISKSLTSMALARLVQAGKLNLDVPVQKYLPNYPKADAPITPRLLASHRAGIRHYRFSVLQWPPNDFSMDRQFDSVSDAIEVFKHDDLLFRPGTNFHYSSFGFNLLSAVLEAASGTDYLSLMRDEVFAPAGMTSTQADVFGQNIPDRVGFYVTGNGRYSPAYPVNLSVKWASGGFLSTPSDLVRAGITVLDSRYLADSSRKLLFTPVAKAPGGEDPKGYALGWYSHVRDDLTKSGEKISVVSHSGGSVGGLSYLMILVDQRMVIAVQTNTSGGNLHGADLKVFSDDLAATILAFASRNDEELPPTAVPVVL